MSGYGTHYNPFLDIKRSNSAVAEIKYQHPKLTGWEFGGAIAGDTGSLYGDNLGFSLSIRKTGLIKRWK